MKKALLLLVLLVSVTGFSQINFEPGYFIDNTGKKTECLIRNIAWKDNPVEFEYRLSEGDETKIAGINEVSQFNVAGYKFRRFNLKIERSVSNTDKMDNYRELDWKDETLFLKVLVEGELALYQYEGTNLVKYFYSAGNHGSVEQLIFKEYAVDARIHENSQYRQQLYNVMKDKITSMERFEKVKYRKDALVDLFNEHNAASGTEAKDYTETQNKSSVNFKVTAGIGFTSLKTENPMIVNSEVEFSQKITFRAGIEIEYIMPFNNRKWALFVDPNYQTYKNDAMRSDTKITVDYNFIELPIGFRHYFYLSDNTKLFLNAAYVFDFNMKNSQVQFGNQTPFEISKTTHFAFGGGYSYDDFSIEARYNLPHGILKSYTYWAADYSTLNVILGYRFL